MLPISNKVKGALLALCACLSPAPLWRDERPIHEVSYFERSVDAEKEMDLQMIELIDRWMDAAARASNREWRADLNQKIEDSQTRQKLDQRFASYLLGTANASRLQAGLPPLEFDGTYEDMDDTLYQKLLMAGETPWLEEDEDDLLKEFASWLGERALSEEDRKIEEHIFKQMTEWNPALEDPYLRDWSDG